MQVSTDEVYGSLGEQGLFTEETPLAPNSPYSASKAGVISFVQTAAYQLGGSGIRVNAICPGGHVERSLELARERAMYKGEPFDEEAFRSGFGGPRENAVIAGRWRADEGYIEKGAGPDDAATIALFLASDEAANMTGQDINSGGGVMW